jgi:hypothetical protein
MSRHRNFHSRQYSYDEDDLYDDYYDDYEDDEDTNYGYQKKQQQQLVIQPKLNKINNKDEMKIGGNGAAKTYFRKHGMGTDAKTEGVEKKYKSKVAQSYRAELAKLVEAEAQKRGEGTTTASGGPEMVESTMTLLQHLEVGDQKLLVEEAKQKLASARAAAIQETAKPTLKPVSSLPGAKGKLMVNQKVGSLSSSSGSMAAMMLKRKPSSGNSKIRVNKLSDNSNGIERTGSSDDAFEGIEETQQAVASAEKKGRKWKRTRH